MDLVEEGLKALQEKDDQEYLKEEVVGKLEEMDEENLMVIGVKARC